MSNQHRHREFLTESTNPVDRIREGTNRNVWNRAGDVLHTIVDGTGAFLAKGAEIVETGVDHGVQVAGSITGIAGSVVGGTWNALRKFGRSFQRANKDHHTAE